MEAEKLIERSVFSQIGFEQLHCKVRICVREGVCRSPEEILASVNIRWGISVIVGHNCFGFVDTCGPCSGHTPCKFDIFVPVVLIDIRNGLRF